MHACMVALGGLDVSMGRLQESFSQREDALLTEKEGARSGGTEVL